MNIFVCLLTVVHVNNIWRSISFIFGQKMWGNRYYEFTWNKLFLFGAIEWGINCVLIRIQLLKKWTASATGGLRLLLLPDAMEVCTKIDKPKFELDLNYRALFIWKAWINLLSRDLHARNTLGKFIFYDIIKTFSISY